MQTIFERSNALATQLASEVEHQYNRLTTEQADAEFQISSIRATTEAAVALEDEHLEDLIRTMRAQSNARKTAITEEGRKRIQFQQDRLNQIEEQLRQFAPAEQQAA